MTAINATRSAVAGPLAAIFRVNDDLIATALGGLSAADLGQRLTNKNNPILWLAGHVAETRRFLLLILGEQVAIPWGELFSRGVELQEAGRYPSVEEINRVMEDINNKLYAKLEAFDDEQLAEPAKGVDLPNAKTVADLIALFAMHDSYHVGQMGFIRKGLGYPRIAG